MVTIADTDSFCCLIQTHDIYRDMGELIELFDTSNFEATHPLYSEENHRVLGKFKSETGSVAPREFVGLRAKMYSLHVPADKKQSKIRAKGIKKSHIKKNVRHEHFLNTLNNARLAASAPFDVGIRTLVFVVNCSLTVSYRQRLNSENNAE